MNTFRKSSWRAPSISCAQRTLRLLTTAMCMKVYEKIFFAIIILGTALWMNSAVAANFVLNGDFERSFDTTIACSKGSGGGSSSCGFANSYSETIMPITVSSGVYAIGTNPSDYAPSASAPRWGNFFDHTTGNGTGRMMIVNGRVTVPANDIILWEQFPFPNLAQMPNALKPNTNYRLSFWVASASAQNPIQLAVDLNNTITTFQASAVVGEWKQFSMDWNSGSATQAFVQIYTRNVTQADGYDFALDDIVFEEVCTGSACTVSVSQVPLPAAVLWLLGAGLLGVSFHGRKAKDKF